MNTNKNQYYLNKILIMLSCSVILLLSCCGYSTHSILPPNLKTIAIPVVNNQTIKPGLGDMLTSQLIDDFTQDRNLKVTPIDKANIVLNCAIKDYEKTPQSYNSDQTVIAYKITLTAGIVATDNTKSASLWEGDISSWITYDAASETEDIGIDRAIKKLSQDILRKTLTSW
jgi:hypothetical protein